MYAIVRTGGKQYKVAEKSVIAVEKLEAEDGSIVELSEVLMIGDENGARLGAPLVDGAVVRARVISTFRGRKVHGLTYKPTKHTQRRYGHRQWHTRLRIESITA